MALPPPQGRRPRRARAGAGHFWDRGRARASSARSAPAWSTSAAWRRRVAALRLDGWATVEQDRAPGDRRSGRRPERLRGRSSGRAWPVGGAAVPEHRAADRGAGARALPRRSSSASATASAAARSRRCSASSATATSAASGRRSRSSAASCRFYQPKHEQAMVHAALGLRQGDPPARDARLHRLDRPGRDEHGHRRRDGDRPTACPCCCSRPTRSRRAARAPVLQQLEHPGSRDLTRQRLLPPGQPLLRPHRAPRAAPRPRCRRRCACCSTRPRPGAVTLALQQDVQGEAYDFPDALLRAADVGRRAPAAAAEELAAGGARARAARGARSIVAGGGVRYSSAEASARGARRARAASRSPRPPPARARAGGRAGASAASASTGRGRPTQLAARGRRRPLRRHAPDRLHDGLAIAVPATRTCASSASTSAPPTRTSSARLPLVADARARARGAAAARSPGWQRAARTAARSSAAERREWRETLAADLRAAAPASDEPGRRSLARAQRSAARPGDWVVAAAGSPPGDLLKLWDARRGHARAHRVRLLVHGPRDPGRPGHPDGPARRRRGLRASSATAPT